MTKEWFRDRGRDGQRGQRRPLLYRQPGSDGHGDLSGRFLSQKWDGYDGRGS